MSLCDDSIFVNLREAIRGMYVNGMSVREIAKSIGMSRVAVQGILKASGVTMRPRGRRPA